MGMIEKQIKDLEKIQEEISNNKSLGVEEISEKYGDIIKVLLEAINNLSVELSAIKKHDGWIPVEERLPEHLEYVLVWFEYFMFGEYNCLYQTIGISYMFYEEWSGFVNGESGWKNLKIIAWQPLPDPYKPKEE